MLCVALLMISELVFAKPQSLTLVSADSQLDRVSQASFQVLKEAYGRLDISVTVTHLPGKRALHSSNKGVVDGELHRVPGIEETYSNLIPIPVAVAEVPQVAFANSEITVDGWSSLQGLRLAISLGYLLAEKNTEGMNRTMVPEWKNGFFMVESGRADVTVANLYMGLRIINEHDLKSVEPVLPPLELSPLYHYLHHRHRTLVPEITEVLESMKREGRIQQIWNDHALLSG